MRFISSSFSLSDAFNSGSLARHFSPSPRGSCSFSQSWNAESPCQLQGNAIAKSILVAWRTIQLATRETWSRYGFMIINKCNNNLRLYDETREAIYGFTVNNKMQWRYRIEVETISHLFQLYTEYVATTVQKFHSFLLYNSYNAVFKLI